MTNDSKKTTAALSPILTDKKYADHALFLKELYSEWTPHDGQIEAGELIFSQGVRRLFLENGRKWGKTEWACDVCWRLGNRIQNGQGYYFGAYQKAVREFLWAPQRIQNHGPSQYVRDIHKTEMRLTWTTNTFLKLDGADEFRMSKGFNPDFVILDEFADYTDDFWHAMSPNFASKDTIVVIISSPPWLLESEPGTPVLFIRIADLWDKYQQEGKKLGKRSKYAYINQPTHKNPHISKEWLDQERIDLIAMGLEDIWEREYMVKRVIGGGKRIVGTYDRDRHMKSHDWIMTEKIEKNRSVLQWAQIVDPSQSNFGTLFLAVNPHTQEVFFLDEILEKQEDETTEHALWPRISAIEKELVPEDEELDSEKFLRTCDEAAKWWIVGCANDPEISINYNPTEKASNSIEFGLSLLRSVFRYNLGYVSDRCKWFGWQMENWRKDKRGNIPDLNCDLIDCGRYGLHSLNYTINIEKIKPTPISPLRIKLLEQRRSPQEDLADMQDAFYGNTTFPASDKIGEVDDTWPH